jgi:hypothetical protein
MNVIARHIDFVLILKYSSLAQRDIFSASNTILGIGVEVKQAKVLTSNPAIATKDVINF